MQMYQYEIYRPSIDNHRKRMDIAFKMVAEVECSCLSSIYFKYKLKVGYIVKQKDCNNGWYMMVDKGFKYLANNPPKIIQTQEGQTQLPL